MLRLFPEPIFDPLEVFEPFRNDLCSFSRPSGGGGGGRGVGFSSPMAREFSEAKRSDSSSSNFETKKSELVENFRSDFSSKFDRK